MEKTDFNKLINKAKSSNSNKTIQKVTPVNSKTADETQFSFYIEKELLKKLKLKALEEDASIKSIVNKSIETYLTKQ
ncbi:hypothetical protein [Lutibacter citreus]|uniref:hypothetical protein n=1 Tax=Lutibacter citreus TaxID=2138210 RepID=UPI000DBE87BA|nr:hypothetical protein [Lutibacter citreus]